MYFITSIRGSSEANVLCRSRCWTFGEGACGADGLRINKAMNKCGLAAGLGTCQSGGKLSGLGNAFAVAAKGIGIGSKIRVSQCGATGASRVMALLVHAYGAVHGVVDDEHNDW